jgi:hypothetical protein
VLRVPACFETACFENMVQVTPKVGRALWWPSVLAADPTAQDHRTVHEALPVVRGEKRHVAPRARCPRLATGFAERDPVESLRVRARRRRSSLVALRSVACLRAALRTCGFTCPTS